MSKVTGKIAQIIGPVIDVEFDSGVAIPKIYDSLTVTKADGSLLVLEVQSHIGENTVRTISMDSTDGLSRGSEVSATGAPIQMPIGQDVYGRLFNVIGDGIDGLESLPKKVTTDYQSTERHLLSRIFLHLQKYCSQELKLSTSLSLMPREVKLDYLEVPV